MGTHNNEVDRRQRDYVRTELMSVNEALNRAQAQLDVLNRRLSWVEGQLTQGHASVQSGPQV